VAEEFLELIKMAMRSFWGFEGLLEDELAGFVHEVLGRASGDEGGVGKSPLVIFKLHS
jgi:hypothetical protein